MVFGGDMGEAKRRKLSGESGHWPRAERVSAPIKLHMLPSAAQIDSDHIRAITGDDSIPAGTPVLLKTFRALAGERAYHLGFCLGDGHRFSAIGLAVIERLRLAAPRAKLHVVPIVHEDVAWDIVLAHLRSFSGQVLLFAFSNSDVYDAGVAEIYYSKDVQVFGVDGAELEKLTAAQRRKIRAAKTAMLNRPPPKLYPASGVEQEEVPWIFRLVTPAGKTVRSAVWNGRRDYAHEIPHEVIRWVGGDRIAVVQVDSPVGVNRRSSLDLTHKLAADFDGVVHWARDSETFHSIIKSFVRLDLECVAPPDLSDGWDPEVTILAANVG